MTDRDALLRAIAANPDDDTPRLIYADLLDETGGEVNVARARFIRLQIDLARNPGRSWFANSDRLCEVAQLAGLFADKWLDELPKWAADEARKQRLRADDFPRGFLESFHVHPATFAAQGHQLLDVAPVTRIVVSGSFKRPALTAFFGSPFLLRVRSLAMPGTEGDLIASYVKSSRVLSAIEELDLSGSSLSDAGAGALAQAMDLGNVRSLAARGQALTEAGVTALLSAMWLPKLRALDVRGATNGFYWSRGLRLRFPKHTILV
jgi:uncharacterized protein (TIGR02996 family)